MERPAGRDAAGEEDGAQERQPQPETMADVTTGGAGLCHCRHRGTPLRRGRPGGLGVGRAVGRDPGPARSAVCAGRPRRTTRTGGVTGGVPADLPSGAVPAGRRRGSRACDTGRSRRRGAPRPGRGCGCGSRGRRGAPASPSAAAFGAALRHRRAAGLTQEALAERAGVGVRTLQGLERGASAPPAGHGPAPGRRAGAARGGAGAVPGRGRAAPARRPGRRPAPAGGLRLVAPPPARPGPAPPGNLPAELSSFVGRERGAGRGWARLLETATAW